MLDIKDSDTIQINLIRDFVFYSEKIIKMFNMEGVMVVPNETIQVNGVFVKLGLNTKIQVLTPTTHNKLFNIKERY